MALTYLKLTMTAVFWGGTFVAGRSIAGHVGPFSAAFLRFLVASFFLVLLTYRQAGAPRPFDWHKLPALFLLGLTGVFAYNLFFFKGLQLITAGRASLIIANNPILIALLSFLFFREKMNTLKVLGIIVSVSGAVIAITRGNPAAILSDSLGMGDAYIFLCVLSWVSYTLVGKRVMQDFTPLSAVTGAAVIGTLMLLLPAWHEGMPAALKHYRIVDWISIVYLGVFGTVLGFVWYYEGIESIGPARASLFINFVPLSAIALGAILLAEPVTPSLIIGAALVSAGVYLTNTASVQLPKIGRP